MRGVRITLTTLGALALHAGVVVWLTWPLAAHWKTAIPNTWAGCHFDTLLVGWALSHESRMLVSAPLALPHAPIYYPEPYALFYAEAGFGALPYFMGPFLATNNPALALNVLLFVSISLTAFTLHLVVAHWSGSQLAGALAGFTFLTTRWVLWFWLPVAPNYAVLQYLPPIMVLAATPLERRGSVVALFALVVLQGLSSIYLMPAVYGPLAVLTCHRLARARTRRTGWRLLCALAAAGPVLAAAYSGYVVVRARNPQLRVQTVYSLTGFGQTPLPWGPFEPGKAAGLSVAAFGVIGLGALALVVQTRWGTVERRALRGWSHALLWTLVGLAISLTPVVSWNGRPFRLPQWWLQHWLPSAAVFREPSRLAVGALLGLSALTGLGFAAVARGFTPAADAGWNARALGTIARTALTCLAAWMLYHFYVWPVGTPMPPWVPLPDPYPVYAPVQLDDPMAQLIRSHGGPVLELPIGPGASVHALAMYRQILHGQPLLNGYSSYWPQSFPAHMALACRLPDADALATLQRETGVHLILVHSGSFAPPSNRPPYDCPHQPSSEAGPPPVVLWNDVASHPRNDLTLVKRIGKDMLFMVNDGSAPR